MLRSMDVGPKGRSATRGTVAVAGGARAANRPKIIPFTGLVTGTRDETPECEQGGSSFKKCQFCHDVGETAKNKLGPALNGLDGRKAATVEGYSYNEGLESSGITWSDETFKEYLRPARRCGTSFHARRCSRARSARRSPQLPNERLRDLTPRRLLLSIG